MEAQEKRLYFIYNPRAGKEHIRGKLYGIFEAMSEAGYEISVHPTRAPRDAVTCIRELPEDVYDLVVCSGGDGTLDEVVTGMMLRESRLPIGYIPSGSCNDFGRSLKIPANMARAARVAVEGENFAVDVGSLNDHNFIYVACFGIFTDVSYTTRQEIKNVLGHMAYLLEGVKQLAAVKSYRLRVTGEDQSFEGDFIYGMVTNSRSVGGFKNIVGKNVLFDDGLFECTFIQRPKNALELQEILAALATSQMDTRYMYSFKSACIEVEALDEEEVPWTLDGEFGGEHRKAVIRSHRKAVEIRVAPEVRDSLSAEKKQIAEQQSEEQQAIEQQNMEQ